MRRTPANAGKPWTRDEVAALRRLADGVHSAQDVARELGRTAASVALKASDERISLRTRKSPHAAGAIAGRA